MRLINVLEIVQGEIDIRLYQGGVLLYHVAGKAHNIEAFYNYPENAKITSMYAMDNLFVINMAIPQIKEVNI